MGSRFSLLLITALLLVRVSLGEISPRAEADQWLRTMGFEDYSSEISQSLAKQKKQVKHKKKNHVGLSPVSEKVLEYSKVRYEVFNQARELASLIYARTKDQVATSPEMQKQVADLTARMLILQPTELPDQWPVEVKTDKEKEEYATKVITKNIRDTAERVTSDIIETIVGKQKTLEILGNPTHPEAQELAKTVNEVRGQIYPYVKLMHLDVEMGQSKFLGDALALLYTRDSRKRDGVGGPLEQTLSAAAKKHGVFLENSTSSSPVFINDKNQEVRMDIKNGDPIFEYSGQREAAEIAWGGRPALRNMPVALRHNLLGHALSRWVHPADEIEIDSASYLGRARLALGDAKISNTGISHVGEARIHTDPETGLSHVKVNDMYPNADYGGVRMVTLGNFALNGPYRRIAVASPDVSKLAAEFLKQTEGVTEPSKLMWRSKSERLNHRTDRFEPVGQKKPWPTLLTPETLSELKTLAATDPTAWYDRVTEGSGQFWRKSLTEDGVRFGTGFVDTIGSAYCSRGVCLAKSAGGGVDIEPHHSRWAFPLPLLKSLGIPGTEIVDPKNRFVAPVSILAQPYQKQIQVIDFPAMTSRERDLARSAPFIPANSKEVALALRSIPFKPEQGTHPMSTDELMETVDGMVRNRRVAERKFGPSRVMQSNYGRNAQHPKDKAKPKPVSLPTEKKYSPEVGKTAVAIHQELEAEGSNDSKTRAAEINDFLVRMRFEDFSKQMREAREKGEPPNELSRQTSIENERAFEVVNTARNLATHILSRITPQMSNPAVRDRLNKLTGELLNLAPVSPIESIPAVLRNEPDLKKRVKGIEDYIADTTKHHGELQLEALVSDYVKTVYGADYAKKHLNPETIAAIENPTQRSEAQKVSDAIGRDISKFTDLCADYLYRIYVDPQIGSTRWLGRAVTLGIAREATLRNKPEYLNELGNHLEAHGHALQNYVGSTLKMIDEKGSVAVDVQSGEPIFGRSNSMESGVISTVAVPKDKKKAAANGLNGNPLSILFPVTKRQVADGLRPAERLRNALAQSRSLNPGFSHVGTIDVAVDPQTKLQHTLIWDNYPHHNPDTLTAGVRLNGMEHFANTEDYLAVGFTKFDFDKLHAYAREQAEAAARTEEWNPIAWKAYVPTLSAEGKIVPTVSPPRGDWMKGISRQAFIDFHTNPDPQDWKQKYQEKVIDGWRQLLRQGTFFNWVDAGAGMATVKGANGQDEQVFVTGKYHQGGGYCSQTCDLASLITTGLDLEAPNNHGKYEWFVPYAKPLVQAARDIDVNERILPPSSLATQDWVDGAVNRIQYPALSLARRAQMRESVLPVEQDLNVTDLIRQHPEYLSALKKKQASQVSPFERSELIHKVLYRIAIEAAATGSRSGLDAIGYDPDEVEKLREKKTPNRTPAVETKTDCTGSTLAKLAK